MPYGDGTGPQRMGPMSGKRMGWCSRNFSDSKEFIEEKIRSLDERKRFLQQRLDELKEVNL